MSSEEFNKLNEEMLKKFLEVNPDVGTGMGLHDPYDMNLPHGGLKRLSDTQGLLRDWCSKAKKVDDGNLSDEDRIALEGLDLSAAFMEFSINEYPLWKMFPDAIEGVGGLLFLSFSRDYAPVEFRARGIASRMQQLPLHLEQFRERFKGSKPVKIWTESAIESCEQFPDFLRFVENSWSDKVSSNTSEALKKGIKDALEAIEVQQSWLKELLPESTAQFPMGREKFERLMKLRGLGITADQILELGERYLEDLKREREVVAERIAPGGGLKGAKAKVEADCPKTFEDALKATEEEMLKARSFVKDQGLATIDDSAILKVMETPAFLAPVLPYAALFMSSKFDPVQEGAYVVTRPKEGDLGSHLNYAAIINTAVHEAYPGHFHQGVRSNGKHWIFQVCQMVVSTDTMYLASETVEGWAHYCEKMMYDHGYGATDPALLEMLNGAIWRAYRIIADIKLARGEATVEEMIEMAVNEVGMPRAAAEAEAKRYTRTPGQALSYLIGRHLIIEFRKELEDQLGERFDEKLFHDSVADYGYLPVSLMREAVRRGMA